MENNITMHVTEIPLEIASYLLYKQKKHYNNIIGENGSKIIDNYSMNNNIKEEQIKKYINVDELLLTDLPSELKISTITISGKLNKKINLQNIDKTCILTPNNITTIKSKGIIRTIEHKIIKKRKKKPTKSFENQLTMIIKIDNNKQVNVKIFKNGSFQMTGFKTLTDCNLVLHKLIRMLSMNVAIFDNEKQCIIDCPYINDNDNTPIEVSSFTIAMINSGFCVDYLINRETLYNIMVTNNINCAYEPCIHAGVKIKYIINNTKVSIFVFQSGSIIITGARNKEHIITAYNYIMHILNTNKHAIIKKNIMQLLDDVDLTDIMNELNNSDNIDIDIELDNIIV